MEKRLLNNWKKIASATGLWENIAVSDTWYAFIVRPDLAASVDLPFECVKIDSNHFLIRQAKVLVAIRFRRSNHWLWKAELEAKLLLHKIREKNLV